MRRHAMLKWKARASGLNQEIRFFSFLIFLFIVFPAQQAASGQNRGKAARGFIFKGGLSSPGWLGIFPQGISPASLTLRYSVQMYFGTVCGWQSYSCNIKKFKKNPQFSLAVFICIRMEICLFRIPLRVIDNPLSLPSTMPPFKELVDFRRRSIVTLSAQQKRDGGEDPTGSSERIISTACVQARWSRKSEKDFVLSCRKQTTKCHQARRLLNDVMKVITWQRRWLWRHNIPMMWDCILISLATTHSQSGTQSDMGKRNMHCSHYMVKFELAEYLHSLYFVISQKTVLGLWSYGRCYFERVGGGLRHCVWGGGLSWEVQGFPGCDLRTSCAKWGWWKTKW